MKSFILSLLFLASSAFAQTTGIIFNWTGNGNAGVPTCSSTVTSSCLTTFTLTDTTTTTSPVVLSSAILPSALTYTLSPLPPTGTHTYSLMINGLDSSGLPVSSPTISTSVLIPAFTLNPPTGFTGIQILVTIK